MAGFELAHNAIQSGRGIAKVLLASSEQEVSTFYQVNPELRADAVTAPLVGIVYLVPEPGAQTFVSVGDTVSEGQTLLIIEAMKVVNSVHSDRAGIVTEILVANGQSVEYGAALMIIEPL